MTTNNVIDEIYTHGDRGAIVPFSRISDLKEDMLELKNGAFHTDWLNRMVTHITTDENRFVPPDLSIEPRSLISVVMPSPKVFLQFSYSGKQVKCAVPPHYTNWYQKNEQARQYLNDCLAPSGYSVATAVTLTQKLLAVHSGLCQYGRNNICYNDEFGSYIQIMSYISDFPCDTAMWFPVKRMEICGNCNACVNSCPTGAIDANRYLINSDRCITYYDEIPGAFPEWLDTGAHNSIVGCSKCQDCCPANIKNKDNIEMGVVFTEEETMELLNNKNSTPYSYELAEKIESTGIPPEDGKPDILPRNLDILIQRHSSNRGEA